MALPVPLGDKSDSISCSRSGSWIIFLSARSSVRDKMRLLPVVVTLSLTVAVAYYVYIPLPDAIQEPWKLMLLDAGFRAAMHLVRDGFSGAQFWRM